MRHRTVLLGHGSGGSLMHQLLSEVIQPAFDNPFLRQGNDQALLGAINGRIAFTTDSYVVNPFLFPGGTIGSLAVNGTINDLAVGGAKPIALSMGLILEEGLRMEDFELVIDSAKEAADFAGVPIVTGDTKVVEKGNCDGIFINTSGIGVVPEGRNPDGAGVRPGDAVILSGTIGDHGVAVLSRRRGIAFETPVVSDTQPLHRLVERMFETGVEIHAMRDPTRGGVATTLIEIARQSGVGMEIDENELPIVDPVQGACDLLGLDPLYLANEGKLLAFVPANDADSLLHAMRAMPEGKDAVVIGRVTDGARGTVMLRTVIGGTRIVTMLSGEQLPRIC